MPDYTTTDTALRLRTLAITSAIARRRGVAFEYRNRRVISPVQDAVREHIRDRQMHEPRQ